MSNGTAKAPRKQAAAPKASLTLTIGHSDYSVTPVRGINDPDVSKAFRLEKAGDPDATYDVALTVHGLVCDCPDFACRHADMNTSGCKHVVALVELGLLERPAAALPIGNKPAPVTTICCQAVEPAPAKVNAIAWASAICGKLFEVATPAQRDLAVNILNTDGGYFHGRRITPIGPSLEELADSIPTPASEYYDDWNLPGSSPFPPAAEILTEADEAADEAETAKLFEGLKAIVAEAALLPDEPAAIEAPDEAGPDAWGAWTDADTWVSTEEPTMSLAEAVEHEARVYRGRGTPVGDFLARELDRLAKLVAFTHATTPEQFNDRRAALDAP